LRWSFDCDYFAISRFRCDCFTIIEVRLWSHRNCFAIRLWMRRNLVAMYSLLLLFCHCFVIVLRLICDFLCICDFDCVANAIVVTWLWIRRNCASKFSDCLRLRSFVIAPRLLFNCPVGASRLIYGSISCILHLFLVSNLNNFVIRSFQHA
jgi:hypothetical protein